MGMRWVDLDCGCSLVLTARLEVGRIEWCKEWIMIWDEFMNGWLC